MHRPANRANRHDWCLFTHNTEPTFQTSGYNCMLQNQILTNYTLSVETCWQYNCSLFLWWIFMALEQKEIWGMGTHVTPTQRSSGIIDPQMVTVSTWDKYLKRSEAPILYLLCAAIQVWCGIIMLIPRFFFLCVCFCFLFFFNMSKSLNAIQCNYFLTIVVAFWRAVFK